MSKRQSDISLGRRRVVLGLIGVMGVMVTGCSFGGTNTSTSQGTTTATPQTAITPTPKVTPGTTLSVYQKHTEQIDDIAWSPDSKYILSASNGTLSQGGAGKPSQIDLWDARTGAPNATFIGNPITIVPAPLAWSPDGKWIAMSGAPDAGGNNTASIYEAQTGKLMGGYTTFNGFLNQLTWSPDSSRLAIAGEEDVEIFNVGRQEKVLSYPASFSPGTFQPSNVVAWSPDGNTIASAAAKDGHSLQFWDAHTGQPLHYFRGSKPDVAVWSPDGKTIAMGSTLAQSPQVLESSTGQVLLTCQTKLPSFGRPSNMRYGIWSKPHTISWSPHSKHIAIANDQNHVQIWEVAKQNLASTYTEHSGPVSAVGWSPNGSRIASASYDKTVRVWQAL